MLAIGKWLSRTLKFITIAAIRYVIYHLLFVVCSNNISIFHHLRDIITHIQKFRQGTWDHTHLVELCYAKAIVHMASQCTKYEVYISSHSRYFRGSKNLKYIMWHDHNKAATWNNDAYQWHWAFSEVFIQTLLCRCGSKAKYKRWKKEHNHS